MQLIEAYRAQGKQVVVDERHLLVARNTESAAGGVEQRLHWAWNTCWLMSKSLKPTLLSSDCARLTRVARNMATGLFRIQRTLVQGVSSWARPSLMGLVQAIQTCSTAAGCWPWNGGYRRRAGCVDLWRLAEYPRQSRQYLIE